MKENLYEVEILKDIDKKLNKIENDLRKDRKKTHSWRDAYQGKID